MSLLAPYLPSHLIDQLAGGRRRDRKVAAALLFSDISGFTALTERLASSGREGAEEIARLVNRAFRPAIRAIRHEGGSILSFGGDALFAIFPGGRAVRRAHCAAEAIRRGFLERGDVATSRGPVRLSLSQAIHFGDVRELFLGEGRRRHYLAVGPSVQALAGLEAKANAGEILLSRQAKRHRSKERGERRVRKGAKIETKLIVDYLDPKLPRAIRGFQGAFRRIAVLFLETKGANAAKLRAWFLALADALDRYDGMLPKSDLSPIGTKWICLFGIPTAHENDPDRAARAALDLLAASSGLEVRGGLHLGTVANMVIGTRSRKIFDVMGDAVNTAARAMGAAARGEILVTDECLRELSGVTVRDRGRHPVKGKKVPLHLHALEKAVAPVKTLHVSVPMVGRDRELGTILAALSEARKGGGAVLGIKGDAGVGKSRLKYEAAKRARNLGFSVYEGRATTFLGMPYWTVGSLIKDALSIPATPDGATILSLVSDASEELGLAPVDRHHLAEVLGARFPDSPIAHLDPEGARLNNNLAVRELFRSLSRRRPCLLVLEDLQWADGASIETTAWLAKSVSQSPIVLLLLYRGGYDPPSGAKELLLADLSGASVAELLSAHLGAVSGSVAKLVMDRAGGNPLYLEELLRHFLESGILASVGGGHALTREILPADLPPGIEILIAARLDRLGRRAHTVAEHASVIGRSFLLSLLKQLKTVSRKAEQGVAELLKAQIVQEKARNPIEYSFRHALTRDVAYTGMLVSHRRRVHRAVANAIEELFSEDRKRYLAMLAHHWEQAGSRKKARESYLQGARAAVERFAHKEAEQAYRAYLRLALKPTEETIQAHNELGERVFQIRGRTEEAESEHRSAISEARSISDRKAEAAGLRSLANLRSDQGRLEEARGLYEEALTLAREVGDRPIEGVVLGNLGSLCREQGRMAEALELFEEALQVVREVGNRRTEGIVLGNLASLHRGQGRMAEARSLYEEALAAAREAGDRRLEGVFLGNLGNLRSDQGARKKAQILYREALTAVREVGDRRMEGIVLGNLANLMQVLGRIEEARRLYEEALAIARDVENRRIEGIVLGNLAMLQMEQGRIEEARKLYEESLRIASEVGDRRSEGIVLAGLATLLKMDGNMEQAHRLYREALGIDREVGNCVFEGHLLHHLAEWELLATGQHSQATLHAARSKELLLAVGGKEGLCKALCTQGHIQLAGGESAEELLEEILSRVRSLAVPKTGELAKAIANLQHAQQAFTAGRPLVCGFAPGDITKGQWGWLARNRPRTIPAEIAEEIRRDHA